MHTALQSRFNRIITYIKALYIYNEALSVPVSNNLNLYLLE